tara:strand:+ start:661 stop:924 length:264 start_codon:yes stop_codon:yes gene_type:complete
MQKYGIKSTKRAKGFYALQVGGKEYFLMSPNFHKECSSWLLSDTTGNDPILYFDCKKFAINHLASEVIQQELESRGGRTKIVVSTNY